MSFKLPRYRQPDFQSPYFLQCPNVRWEEVQQDGVAPANFHATTIYPEYYKINGNWLLLCQSRMDCAVALTETGRLEAKEFRRLKTGDRIITGRSEDGSAGIYIHASGFADAAEDAGVFAFRTGRSRETSYSRDYDRLYDLLRFEKEHGRIVWVLGPAVVFDSDSKKAMIALIENGYAHAILAGNALATHDLEGAVLNTALGQDIYTQQSVPDGHYHHLDILNMARRFSSLREFIQHYSIDSSVMAACSQMQVPVVLAGSIRDDGPLPEVTADVYQAQNAMRCHTRTATTMLCLATQLHSIAAGNMTPSYQVMDGQVRPVYIYNVDISEFAVNKLRDRGTLEVTSIVTNIQDFLVNLSRNLIGR
ncbi:MAG: hypothetical protein E6X17_00955 [Sporomusaceae bacterium]|nr:hypothetical protein [Sporomusaceae bacterium]